MAIIMTEDQKAMVELAKQFAEGDIAPYSQEMDETGHMRPEIVAKMAELGFMGINIPEEYGGAGLDEVTKILVIEEIAKVDASVAELLSVHTLVSDIIMKRGNEEQKKKYRLYDNKTGELASWDQKLLSEELSDVDFQGYDFGQPFTAVNDDDGDGTEESGPKTITCPCCGEVFVV